MGGRQRQQQQPAHLRPDQGEAQLLGVVDLHTIRAGAFRRGEGLLAVHACRAAQKGPVGSPITCQALPTLTVTNVAAPRRCTAKGTASVMRPSALKGWKRAMALSPSATDDRRIHRCAAK